MWRMDGARARRGYRGEVARQKILAKKMSINVHILAVYGILLLQCNETAPNMSFLEKIREKIIVYEILCKN